MGKNGIKHFEKKKIVVRAEGGLSTYWIVF